MKSIRQAVKSMKAYIPGEKAPGDDFIILNANENPYPPSPKVIKAINDAMQQLKWYPESSSKLVREAAAEVYSVDADKVMLANSSDEMLRILFQACVGEGDEVYAFTPSFTFYQTLANVQGADFKEIEFDDDYNMPVLPNFSNTKLIFFPNPGAPSGVPYSVSDMRKLIEAAPKGLVVIDEAYADFDENKNSVIQLIDEYPNLVVTRTFSKSYSLAGLRIGLGFASKEIMSELHKVRDYYNVDQLAQAGARAALMDQDYLRENCGRIRQTREWFSEELVSARLAQKVWESGTNFVLARFGNPQAVKLYDRLKENKILVRYWNKPRLDDCLRISIGKTEDMWKVIEVIRDNI